MRLLIVLLLTALTLAANAAPSAVSTFHSIGLYWSPAGGAESNAARVEFRRQASADAWRQGLDLWFDARNSEYRGSLVELEPGTAYEVKLTLPPVRPKPSSANLEREISGPANGPGPARASDW